MFGNGLVAMLRRGLRPGADVPACVEEMLRFDSALQLFKRTAREPVEVGAVTVEQGEKVAVLLGSANRYAAAFDHPDEMLVDRDPNPHVAFGVGVHFCLGAPLARMELAESLTGLGLPASRWRASRRAGGGSAPRGFRRVQVGGGAD